MAYVCVWLVQPAGLVVVWGKKQGGGLASDRQVSWQAHGLLITQGLPAPLGAVSNMSEHNQPETLQSTTSCVCVCVYFTSKVKTSWPVLSISEGSEGLRVRTCFKG